MCEDLLGLSGRSSGLLGLLKQIRFSLLFAGNSNLGISRVLLCFLLPAHWCKFGWVKESGCTFFCS